MHYSRWKRHGDPHYVDPNVRRARRFYEEVVLQYDGDDCLTWPFKCDSNGYGQIWIDGRGFYVSRLVCEEEHGPPPTPGHEAAHSCGKGHVGCCAKSHLSWKTKVENHADKLIHGTHLRGENSPNAKLAQADVLYIRALKGGVRQADMAEHFGVSVSLVSSIQSGRNWGWID